MCGKCGRPSGNLRHLREIIGEHGWAVISFEGNGSRPPWAYTAGLTGRGRPELVVTAMEPHRARGLLDDVAAHLLRTGEPDLEPGERLPGPGNLLLEAVAVEVPSVHLLTAVDLYGPGVHATQLVHADARGRWPWRPGWQGPGGRQPVLGPRAGATLAQAANPPWP
ncbi:DUF4262 domain-containing protein [Amycolatopsis thermophila]|uniref:DUF4262 domain-containing protein n=1 Tax=Amycolatopsis thermophila TaxID=206084 RepID=A0ABU0EP04_9PSEU|nr:DUF4262 domain-containing protein [Amycolatopsis thermophila]MDQ0377024.1 hypothetical protein [Amycolatopsis thermophila]